MDSAAHTTAIRIFILRLRRMRTWRVLHSIGIILISLLSWFVINTTGSSTVITVGFFSIQRLIYLPDTYDDDIEGIHWIAAFYATFGIGLLVSLILW